MTRFTVRVVTLLLAAPAAAGAQPAAELARQADALFAQYATGSSPGLAVAVVRRGIVIFQRGYGLADVERRIPITTSTVFDAGSVSKQFTGLAVAMLVTEGALSLNENIRTYLPEMHPSLPAISVRQLLHHSSGLRDFVGGLRLGGLSANDSIGVRQMLRFATHQQSLNFAPGSEYSYSNTGYALLAVIVSRVSGEPFDSFVSERLLRPLAMRQSGYPASRSADLPQPAHSYTRAANGPVTLAPNVLNVPGSSSLRTSVDDLILWVRNFDDAKVAGRAAMDLARRPDTLISGAVVQYGFGVELGRYRGAETVEHSGGWAGYTANIMYFPAHQSSIIVLSNFGVVNPIRASRALADVFLADVLGQPDTIARPVAATVEVAPEVLDRYRGVYRLGPAWYLRIGRDGASLTAQATGEPKARGSARSDTDFWFPHYNSSITFVTDTVPAPALIQRGVRAPRVDERGLTPPASLSGFTGVYHSEELGTTYSVTTSDDRLVLTSAHTGRIVLTHAWGDEFSGSAFPFTAVSFERDGNGSASRLSVYVNDRNRNVVFLKRPGPT